MATAGPAVQSLEAFIEGYKKQYKPKERADELPFQQPINPEDDVDEYNFEHQTRGLAVIICNEHFDGHERRVGAHVDVDNLEKTFTNLEFTVEIRRDLKGVEMEDFLQKVAANEVFDHRNADCFVCAIMSHGGEEKRDGMKYDIILGKDGNTVPTSHFLSIFKDDCCPELAGKPKLFFIQACRGTTPDVGIPAQVKALALAKPPKRNQGETTQVDSSGETGAAEGVISPPQIYKDFLLMYAAPPGHPSLRNEKTGSWMIQCLHEEMEPGAVLQRSLTRVSHRMSRKTANPGNTKCVPCIMSSLTKTVRFTPSDSELCIIT